jgi:hypothetical protein
MSITPEQMYESWKGLFALLPLNDANAKGVFKVAVDKYAKMYSRMSMADQGELAHIISVRRIQ